MSSNAAPLIPNPVVRFRMRTLLAATTAIAVLAAIAGPYYRRQSPAAQTQLLIFWASLACATAIWLPYQLRSTWQMPTEAGEAKHILSTAHSRARFWRTWPGGVLTTGMWLAFVAAYSHGAASRADRGVITIVGTVSSALHGGMVTACMLLVAVPRPAVLSDNGVWLGRAYVPWKFIRHAEWLAARPGVLKFRRLDGDIYVEVPASERDVVEAFVRGKTSFVDAATTHAPERLAPGH